MKRFDSEANLARMIERIRMDENWALILSDGTIASLLSAIAEGRAEDSRYMEYLLGEKKWKTAMNYSSLIAQSDLIGYKRQLPQSAIGYIIVSHTDEDGQNRLENYGSYFFNLDAESDWDDIEQIETDSLEKTKALVPWTCSTPYTIPKGTIFKASNGTEFISTKSVISRVMTKPWSQISSSEDALQNFYSAGGWNGIKYCKVPVIQGIQRSVSIGQTSSARFEAFTLGEINVEAANNSISQDYFKVRLVKGNVTETYIEIDNIYRAGPYDKVFEKKINKDGTGVIIKFGDGISGKLPEAGYTVYVDYLETKGSEGDIDAKYQITSMVFPNDEAQVDPRTNTTETFLYCTNTCAIQGGKDIEEMSDFKNEAPTSYLKSYTIGTAEEYLNKIMKYSPLSLLHCKVYPKKDLTTHPISHTIEDYTDKVANEVSIISDNLQITCVLANGEVVDADDADEELISPLLLSLSGQISPNDTFTYVEPNLIKMAPSIKVRTSDLTINDDTAKGLIKTAIANEYDIYSQDFEEPLYTSKITELSSIFSWTDSAVVMNEALASVDYDYDKLVIIEKDASTDSLDTMLVAIPFHFDKLFSQDQYAPGFKNCTVNSDYLLKVDLNFINGADSSLDRTFFLYDNRLDESGDTTLESAKGEMLDEDRTVPETSASYTTTIIPGQEKLTYYKENVNGFENRQVRVAQFDYISDITDAKFMAKAKSFKTSPLENRPYIQDTDGTNKTFTTTMVDESLRASTSSSEDAQIGATCFKKNQNYINGVNIIFNERYEDTDSEYTGDGYVVIPLDYFQFDEQTLVAEDYSTATTNFMQVLQTLLEEYVSIKVYAQPKMEEFEPSNENDIIYIPSDDIKVEKEVKY